MAWASSSSSWELVTISPFADLSKMTSEVPYGHSRLDFLLEQKDGKKIWIEVKGCTLAIDNVALFPDAPTQRGSKHLQTLISICEQGLNAALIILVFRPEAIHFAPHREMDPKFTTLFYQAIQAGVKVFPLLLNYDNDKIYYESKLPVCSN